MTTPERRRAAPSTGRRCGVAGIDGLAVAGDWVGPAGTLADAAILSGHAAASAIMETAMTAPAITA